MKRALIPIYAITFIDILGFTILVPLLPYIAERYGASPPTVGLFVSTVALFATVSSPFWGALSDRIGRKNVLLSSQVCTLAGYVLLAIPGSLLTVVFSRVVAGIGGGNLGVAQSYVADVTDPDDRDQAYAFQAAAFGAGFVVGPLISGLLVRFGYEVPFYAATALEIVIITLTVTLLPSAKAAHQGPRSIHGLVGALNTPALRNVLARQFLYIFGFTYLFTILGLYVNRALHLGPSQTSVFLGLAGAVGAVAQVFLVHRLTQRFGLLTVSNVGLAIGAVAYLGLSFVTNVRSFVVFLVLWAASGGLIQPTLSALISETAPESERGLILGVSDALNNVALVIAPAVGAAIINADVRATGLAPALALGAAFALSVAQEAAARRRTVRER